MSGDAVPADAITAAAEVLHDAIGAVLPEPMTGRDLATYLAERVIAAVGPLIAEQERQRIRQLAIKHHATWLDPCDRDDQPAGRLHTHHRRSFADLLGGADTTPHGPHSYAQPQTTPPGSQTTHPATQARTDQPTDTT